MTEQVVEKITCKLCGSSAVVKFGHYQDTQLYWCKSCKRKFKNDNSTFHMKIPANQVSSSLSMYYEGMSIEAIRRQLKQEHGTSPSSATIYEWIRKYTHYAVDSIKDYHPKVGDTWVADETVLRIDGKNVWFWDIIDSRTRFLLASWVSTTRTTSDAKQLMERATKRAGRIPKVIITDKLRVYLDGIETVYGGDTKHKQSSPFELENNTNLIERFHGTLRARTKVMRGLKNINSAVEFTDGWLTHYNYLRPHLSLNGKTPADVAGIDYPHANWDAIVRNHKSNKVVVSHSNKDVNVSYVSNAKSKKARKRAIKHKTRVTEAKTSLTLSRSIQ